MHALANIAESGAQPMQKTVALRGGDYEKIQGSTWAQQAVALCISTAGQWNKLAQDLFGMTTQQREGAIKAWRDWKSAKIKARKNGEEQHPAMDEKTFKRIMATATVRLSHMSTIAKAIDAGMDYETLRVWYKLDATELAANLSIDAIYDVAKTFGQAKAGRKADTFVVKLGKFLEAAGKTLADDDLENYNKVVEFVNATFGE